MAGSDKKEQKLASRESTSGGIAPLAVQDPNVSHFVLPGVPQGLIPRRLLDADQTTTITTWDNTIVRTEYFELQITRAGSDEWVRLQEHIVRETDPWVPLVFTIPSSFFLDTNNEGPFHLRYKHENGGGSIDYSNRVPIYIDKIPPNGATPPKQMVFAVTPPITDASFGTDDYLEATIPGWDGDSADVKVAFGWLKGELPEKPEDIDLIGPQDITPGGTVRIPKDKFIDAGDGLCCGGYVLIDKAGNISALSYYELMSVALGPLPVPLLTKATVTDATGGELLRSDIEDGGVLVNIPHIPNGKSTDTIVVAWHHLKLEPSTPVGGNPSTGTKIFVPWEMILDEYGDRTGVVDVELVYEVLRGVEPFPSDIEIVKCNLSTTGPENPDPEPGNPNLKKVAIVGESGVDNELIASDEDKEINAHIELVDPLENGDSYQVMWNGTPIGIPYVIDVTRDTAGVTIKIPLDWDDIRSHGPSAAMPVWYELSNPVHENHQEPEPRTGVKIDFLVLTMPEAEPRHTNASGWLTCNSLRWSADTTPVLGIEYLIPPNPHMKRGDTVEVEWKGYKDFANPVLETNLTLMFADISEAQEREGIVCHIGPYATMLLPIWSKPLPLAKGEVKYTVLGKPAASTPTNTCVFWSAGEGSCNIPPAP